MENNIISAIIRTLSYADIFDYALTESELYKYLISPCEISRKKFVSIFESLVPSLVKREGFYYFLSDRDGLSAIRKERYIYSVAKLVKARRIANIISRVPSVLFIGVSGSLSMLNCKRDDDIDFFIIVAPKTLWISRLVITLTLIFLGVKRRRLERFVSDKICPNMYMSVDNLRLPLKNLYIAHEVVQLMPLYNKGRTYEKFLNKNKWVNNFLPHALSKKIDRFYSANIAKKKGRIHIFGSKICSIILIIINQFFYSFQYYYMLLHKNDEIITADTACFHPEDKSHSVESFFRRRYYSFLLWKHIRNKNQQSKIFLDMSYLERKNIYIN